MNKKCNTKDKIITKKIERNALETEPKRTRYCKDIPKLCTYNISIF